MKLGFLPGVKAPLISSGYTNPWVYNSEHTTDGNTLLLHHTEDNAADTNIVDSSGNGYTSTASANTTNIYNGTGQFSGCFYGNITYYGTNAVAGFRTAIDAAMAAKMTAECYMACDLADWSTHGNANNVFKLLYYFPDGNNGFQIFYTNFSGADELRFVYKAGGTANTVAVGALDDTSFHHVALQVDVAGDVIKAFVDGTQEGTDTGLGTYAGADGTLGIAAQEDGSNKFDGKIDEVAISNTTRY